MLFLGDIVFSCSRPQELFVAVDRIKDSLPDGWNQQFVEIAVDYSTKFGLERAYERMNNRTVAAIFAEYDDYQFANAKEIASGEVDGMRYHLYEAPKPRPENDERKAGE
jgi:hypothetical protein